MSEPKKGIKDIRLTACVDAELAEVVWEKAADEDRTVSWMVSHLIEIGLRECDGD